MREENTAFPVNAVHFASLDHDQVGSAAETGFIGGCELQVDVDVLDRQQVRGTCSRNWTNSSPEAMLCFGAGLGDINRRPSTSSV